MAENKTLDELIRDDLGLSFPDTFSLSWVDMDGERHEASFEAETEEELRRKVNEHGPEPMRKFRDATLVRGPIPHDPTLLGPTHTPPSDPQAGDET